MKIAITTGGTDLDAPVDPRFGRAQRFLIYDTEANDFALVDNAQNLQAPQGAGIQSGRTVAQAGVKAVLTGHCGPKAYQVLAAAGIDVCVGAQGTVREAIEAWRTGALVPTAQPDVTGHWS
jgi:predicted Fe-Mo cluster-binding NifX family protein